MDTTKRPWKILPRNRNLANGRGPGYDVQKDDSDGLGEVICDKATLSDALLIVRAVNHFDEMVEVLENFSLQHSFAGCGGGNGCLLCLNLKARALLQRVKGE